MPVATTTCDNCGTGIGKLETPYVYNDHVVCATCYSRIAQTKGGPHAPSATVSRNRFTHYAAVFVLGAFVLGVMLAAAGILPRMTKATGTGLATSPPAEQQQEIASLRAQIATLQSQIRQSDGTLRALRDEASRSRSGTGNVSIATAAPVPIRFTLSGSVWLNRSGGTSDIQRGLSILILKPVVSRQTILRSLQLLQSDLDERVEYLQGQARAKDRELNGGLIPSEAALNRTQYKNFVDDAAAASAKISDVKKQIGALTDNADLDAYWQYMMRNRAGRIPFEVSPSDVVAKVTTDINGGYAIELPPGNYRLFAYMEAIGAGRIAWYLPVVIRDGAVKCDLHNSTASLMNQ